MSTNVIELFGARRWRVLVGNHNADVRHAFRTLIEGHDLSVVEVADGEGALRVLEFSRLDLLLLELDLPTNDGIAVMQLHRVLLAHQRVRVDLPAVLFTLAPEVYKGSTLTDYLLSLGAVAVIDDAPRSDLANLVARLLQARAARNLADKPAVA